jgi:hypothetical protein
MPRALRAFLMVVTALLVMIRSLIASEITAEARDFFEAKIRPVLVAECYECHAGDKRKGGLLLDSRDALRQGGDSGEAIVIGDASKSLLIQTLDHSHLDADMRMPKNGAKLDDATVQDFIKWINRGAPDPRDAPSLADAKPVSWEQVFALRKQWWSLQEIKKDEIRRGNHETGNPVDAYITAKLTEQGLEPAAQAPANVLRRRLSFALTGLPPSPETATDTGALTDEAWDKLVTQYLDSPAFGETWARHWMDVMRYAETHGSEGDPEIPQAWRYRDYLVRAFNTDLPYDRLVQEHIAGDLLEPRWNQQLGINESLLGTVNLRLVEHGFQPVDSLDEQVKTVDNQIDVLSKAFLGLTVSCARCHDHKFDAISQKDYYALYGIFSSTRPGQVILDKPEALALYREALTQLKASIKAKLAVEWLEVAKALPEQLQLPKEKMEGPLREAIQVAEKDPSSPLHVWVKLSKLEPEAITATWNLLVADWKVDQRDRREFNEKNFTTLWDVSSTDFARWFKPGQGFENSPSAPGDFSIEPEGELIFRTILPAGVYSHLLSSKHGAVLTSPRFKMDTEAISLQLAGRAGGGVRVIIDNYPLGNNATYPQARVDRDELHWVKLDTTYRKGSSAYVELATFDDSTRPQRATDTDKGKDKDSVYPAGRSAFGVAKIVMHKGTAEAPREEQLPVFQLQHQSVPAKLPEVADVLAATLGDSIVAWKEGRLNAEQQAYLDFFVSKSLLPVSLDQVSPDLQNDVAQYRKLESEIPIPQRAPGPLEADGFDAHLFVRGEHSKPDVEVPRAFLSVLGGTPCCETGSGRLQLAKAMTQEQNPLLARVMVNRIWHWLFGQGLVPTVDNFGRLGDKPTHPELLDYLAGRFAEEGYSVKKMVRLLLTSQAWRQSSQASSVARERDPANIWLSHARVRRLDAESIRDTMLFISRELDESMGGVSVPVNNAKRRSIYLTVRRNALSPFMEVFDRPKPFTTSGRREVTNVPAQSLTLLNDPFVIRCALSWAAELVQDEELSSSSSRIKQMFLQAFHRAATPEEIEQSQAYLATLAPPNAVPPKSAWRDLAHSLFNLKEFIYLR